LTLAGDVPSPYYRRDLLGQCGDALLALGRFAQAENIFQELYRDLNPDDKVEELRVKAKLALLANRQGRRNEAEQTLSDAVSAKPGDAEAQGILGRVYKDMWRTTWSDVTTLPERVKAAWRNVAIARRSLASYEIAVQKNLASYFNGINVATLATLIQH